MTGNFALWIIGVLFVATLTVIGALWRRMWKLQGNDMQHILERLGAIERRLDQHIQGHIDHLQ